MGVSYTLNIPSGTTQSDMETTVCSNIAYGTTKSLTLQATGTQAYLIPGCVLNISSTLTFVSLGGFSIYDLGIFSDALTYLNFGNCKVFANATALVNVIDLNSGNLLWPALFAKYPLLSSLAMSKSSMTGPLTGSVPASLSTLDISTNGFYGDWPATFLAPMSTSVVSLLASNNNFNGTIADGAFSCAKRTLSSFDIDLKFNYFTGNLPAALFTGIHASSFSANFQSNRFSGALPGNLFNNISTPSSFLFAIPTNGFTSIPDPLFPNLGANDAIGTTSFIVNVGSNFITNSLTSTLFTGVTPQQTASFFANNNSFSGSISQDLLTGFEPTFLTLSMAQNKLSGSLPDTLFTSGSTVGTYSIDFSSNGLTGTFPASFLGVTGAASMTNFYIRLNNNKLSGTLPSSLFLSPPPINLVYLDLSFNSLYGSVPSTAISSLSSTTITLNLRSNKLNGTLPGDMFDAVNATSTSITFDASTNSFTSTIPAHWASVRLASLQLADNKQMSGSIPSDFFQNPIAVATLRTLNITGSGFTGVMPTMGNVSTLQGFYASNTAIDFCSPADSSPSRLVWSPAYIACDLSLTDVCPCQNLYPTACQPGCSVPTSAACDPKTKPAGDFVCTDGVWVLIGDITDPTLTIPRGGTVVIVGSLNSTGLIIDGIPKGINVTGECASLETIELNLNEEDLAKFRKGQLSTVLISCSSGSDGTSGVQISPKVTSSSCKKVKAVPTKSITGSRMTLGGLFTLSTSGCNTWWIILVAVLGGVVVIALAVFILLAIFNPKVRSFVRPYHDSNARRATANRNSI